MSDARLVLHSLDPRWAPPSPPSLLAALREWGLAGDTCQSRGNTHYRPGDAFARLVTFLGCSPTLFVDDQTLNHVEISAVTAQPGFLGGEHIRGPRCPQCRQPVAEWRRLVEAWSPTGHNDWHCPACRRYTPLPALDWRHGAGFGRVYIALWGIANGVALPSDELLGHLAGYSGGPWRWFYSAGARVRY